MMEKKINAGAVFFQTQPIFDIAKFRIFAEQVKKPGVKLMPGVILLKSMDFINTMMMLPGVNIPKHCQGDREGSRPAAARNKDLRRYHKGTEKVRRRSSHNGHRLGRIHPEILKKSA